MLSECLEHHLMVNVCLDMILQVCLDFNRRNIVSLLIRGIVRLLLGQLFDYFRGVDLTLDIHESSSVIRV